HGRILPAGPAPMTKPSSPSSFTLADFDFALPPELVAQHPASERSGSRLLDGSSVGPVDRRFRDLPDLLRAGDLLVVNDTKVVKARLLGAKASGGAVQALVERVGPGCVVLAHLRASKAPKSGSAIRFADAFDAEVRGRAGLRLSRRRSAAHQLPSAEEHAVDARLGVLRPRPHHGSVSPRDRRALPFLQLRRCDAARARALRHSSQGRTHASTLAPVAAGRLGTRRFDVRALRARGRRRGGVRDARQLRRLPVASARVSRPAATKSASTARGVKRRAAGHRVVSFLLDAAGQPMGAPWTWIAGWTAASGVRPLGAPTGLCIDP